jgi:hypothetical protein
LWGRAPFGALGRFGGVGFRCPALTGLLPVPERRRIASP